MPENESIELKGANQPNYAADLYANLLENTFSKSPMVSDSYMAPYNSDKLYQKTFDYSIYEKMLNDDQVSVCLSLKKDLILGSGAYIQSQETEDHELVEFLERILFQEYNGNFLDDIEELLTAYEFGFSITEKIFKKTEYGLLGIKELKTRHPNTWLIHQDDKGNVTKFEQITSKGNIEIDPRTIIHYVNNKRFQNPYGSSDLTSCYNAWFTKNHIVRFFSIFLEKAASPIPYGKYDKNAPPGTADKLLEILKRFQTKTALAFPKDIDINFLDAKNNGDVYHKAIHLFNMIIGRALFVPDLVGFTGSETGGGSLALGKEQMNLFFMHINRRRSSLEEVINKEIIKPIINYNFGFVEHCPKFKFKPIDESKAIELAKVWIQAVNGGAYKPNDEEVNHFRKLVNFPEGDVERQQQPMDGVIVNEEENDLAKPQAEPIGQESQEENAQSQVEAKGTEVDNLPEGQEREEIKEFAKSYDQTPGDYHKKVNFKAIKTKLDDYDNSAMSDSAKVVRKMMVDLFDQIERKKILQTQNTEKIDTLSLKYKKELKQALKSSFMQLYIDAKSQAQEEIQKSNFAKPLVEDKFLEIIEDETFKFVGDYEYGILKRTRTELIAAIKDGRPLSSVISVLTDDLKAMSEVQIERFARTKHTEVMNNARKEYFDSTGVVSGYQYSAILDDRTSDICSGLHGKFFKAGTEPVPPMHFNCRSTLIPITKYEEFKPTETIRGISPDKFIEEYKGTGFSKYDQDQKPEKIDLSELDFTTEIKGKEHITTYYKNKVAILKKIATHDDNGNLIGLTTEELNVNK